MNILQEHLGEMENLGHSPSRYAPKSLAYYLRTAFSNLTGYHCNQFRKVKESDVIEHVPQKESLYPKDLVNENIDAGNFLFNININEASRVCIDAIDLNKKYDAGLDDEICFLTRKILDTYGRLAIAKRS